MEDFNGFIGITEKDSLSSFIPKEKLSDAPNIIYIVLDDVGFAQLGCYGSNIHTPNIDKLAEAGLRYNNFHTTAICSATRASLLTGANHHSVGVSTVVDSCEGNYPNSTGYLNPQYATTAEVLKEYGYANFAVGKWHLAPFSETLEMGPYHNWPLGKGFDRYYGFLEGMTDQYNPNLVRDNTRILPPKTAAEGYHLSEDLAEQAIHFVGKQQVAHPEQPFFLYLAFGAAHAPHQAPKEYIEHYKGKFDAGWDVIREQWFENQKKLGIIPENTKLNPRNECVTAWEDLSADERKVYARFMEVYAGFLEHTDAQIGRVIDYLDKIGIREHTMIVLLSDNGASSEGGKNGGINHEKLPMLHMERDNVKFALEHLDEIGSSEFTYPHYPAGWANVGNTPFQWYKSWVHAGGVKDPFIISYPEKINAKGEIRSQYIHVSDIAPTVLETIGVTKPKTIKGIAQRPYQGVSFYYTFHHPEEADRKHAQYFEMLGHRAIWSNGWKAVTNHGAKGGNYMKDVWELYHVAEDYSESTNLAEKYPEKLQELISLWYAEAGKYGVLPLNTSVMPFLVKTMDEFGTPTERFMLEAQRFEYHHVNEPQDIWVKTMFNQRNHKITVRFSHKADAEGILYSAGHRFGGYVLYVKEGRLKYTYNNAREEYYKAESRDLLPEGEVTVQVQMMLQEGGHGKVRLFVNGKAQGETEIKKFVFIYETRASLKDGVGTEVSDDYTLPFVYPGELEEVILEAPSCLADAEELLEYFFDMD